MPLYRLGDHQPDCPIEGEFWVAPDAHVIGQVTLARHVGVWFGAVLRGDNEPITVGERTNVQEGAMLHTDMGYPVVIGAGCTIGHHAIIHGCTLGDNVLIGMGATVMNGADIGSNSMVGANALVTERKVYPPGSLIVGSPAKAIRALDDAAVAGLRVSADHYVEAWLRFSRTLTRLDVG